MEEKTANIGLEEIAELLSPLKLSPVAPSVFACRVRDLPMKGVGSEEQVELVMQMLKDAGYVTENRYVATAEGYMVHSTHRLAMPFVGITGKGLRLVEDYLRSKKTGEAK